MYRKYFSVNNLKYNATGNGYLFPIKVFRNEGNLLMLLGLKARRSEA
jgi:hypothetical protein